MKYSNLIFCIVLTVIASACSKDDNTSNSSSSNSKSHNAGKNCLACHSFSVAGTVYDSSFSSEYSSAVIEITSGPDGTGTVLATLSSDKNGNFYTNSSVKFGSGAYVNVLGNNGPVKYMSAKITTGACNICHTGNSTARVWAQ